MPIWLWRLLWPLRTRLHPGAEIGGCFPDFTLRDGSGREHSLYDARPGTHTVLWLTNLCEDCRVKIPLLEEVRCESNGRVRVLAVSILAVDDPLPAQVAPKCGFPILLDPEDVVALRLGQAHPPGACPMRNVYIVDGAGTIRFKHHLSAIRPEEFRSIWRKLSATLFLVLISSAIAAARAVDFDSAQVSLNTTLSARVHEGRVDYAGLKEDSSGLDAWLAAAAGADEADFKGRPPEERLAFLINLYNAATLRLILDHYPIASIRKIGPVWDPNKAWKLPVVRAFGRTVTLNSVEHEMIRSVYKDPRVHFALVCAANGCPPLRSEAYVGARLNAQLDDQARVFLSQKAKNDASRAGAAAYLSPIFKWYMEDFGGSKKSVLNFVKQWLPVEESSAVAWTEYDWSLNEDKK